MKVWLFGACQILLTPLHEEVWPLFNFSIVPLIAGAMCSRIAFDRAFDMAFGMPSNLDKPDTGR
ncbi:MAG TPA: hypothetical protein DER02_12235 [Gammaproteobacteria bacterium]|nr:hypothetical protein [Gammaproteobacteria bacterium]